MTTRAASRPPAAGPLAILVALVIVAMAQGALWAIVTPPLNGPDEEAHVAYAQYLAETGKRPQADDGTGSLSTQLSTFVSAIGAQAVVQHPEGRIDWPAGSSARSEAASGLPADDGSGPNAAASYPPLYYVATAAAYLVSPDRSITGRLLSMRMVGVALFGVTVALAWMLAAILLAGTWPRVVAAGMVALQPKLGFTAGVVNPDILLIALTSAFLVASALIVRSGVTWQRCAGVVAIVAAAALTHPRGLFLVVPLAFVAWFACWQLVAGREAARRAVGAAGIAGVALFAFLVAALAVRWGDSGPASDIREFGSYIWQFYFPRLDVMTPFGPPYGYRQVFIETFFSTFGQLDVSPSIRFADFVQLAAFIGLVALYTTVVARWRTVVGAWPVVALLALTVGALLLLLHLVGFRELQTGGDPIITGRYLLCAVSIYGLAVAWVLSSLPRRAGPMVAAPILTGSALLSIAGIGLTALRFYG